MTAPSHPPGRVPRGRHRTGRRAGRLGLPRRPGPPAPYPRPDQPGLRRGFAELHPPHHRAGLDRDAFGPGPRGTGDVRIPQPSRPFVRSPGHGRLPLRDRAPGLGLGGRGRPLLHHRGHSAHLAGARGSGPGRGVFPHPGPGSDLHPSPLAQGPHRPLGRRGISVGCQGLPAQGENRPARRDPRHDPDPLSTGPPPDPRALGLFHDGGDRRGPAAARVLAAPRPRPPASRSERTVPKRGGRLLRGG